MGILWRMKGGQELERRMREEMKVDKPKRAKENENEKSKDGKREKKRKNTTLMPSCRIWRWGGGKGGGKRNVKSKEERKRRVRKREREIRKRWRKGKDKRCASFQKGKGHFINAKTRHRVYMERKWEEIGRDGKRGKEGRGRFKRWERR